MGMVVEKNQAVRHWAARMVVLGLLVAVIGCGAPAGPHGSVQGEGFSSGELWQSDSNRMATLAMRDNLDSLWRIADKLYQRNPAEWKKSAQSRQEALTYLRIAVLERQDWADLQGQRDVAALSLALQPHFVGDRVAAFVYAAADTIIAAHAGKIRFTLVDSLEPQHLYNAARNMEIANWILNSRHGTDGKPLLLSNQLDAQGQNLSFEREMGKIIGRLDLLAGYATERYRRSVIGYGQSLVAGPFLQFLPVR